MGTSFENSKTLCGEGSILLILGIVPYVGWLLGIIGIILLLRGLKELSNYYQDNEIYQNSLTGVKYYIIALVAAAVAIVAILIGVGTATGFKFGTATGFKFGTATGFKFSSNFTPTVGFEIGLATFLGVIAFIFYVLAALHLRKTFNTLAEKSGKRSFATAATLLWWGSILTILLVGLILIFIAWIFAVIGFFSMKSQQQQPNAPQQYSYTSPSNTGSVSPPSQTARYCYNCGAPIRQDATYCPQCGKQLTS